MTANKDFKRLVRSRMHKTGESYTAARLQLLTRTAQRPKPAAPSPAEYAALAGLSDAAIKAKTGCTWERWVKALDYRKAYEWPHREIAEYVQQKFKVPDWWCQMVTVGYERIKGLRAIGQQRDGSYEASKSKVIAVPVSRLYRAWHDARTRARWLPDVKPVIRTATAAKSMRLTWPDGTSVLIGFAAKGAAKSQVAIQHVRLPDRETATRMKEYWAARLGALTEVLAPPSA
ncbi:MAG TPA: hypothetical protein VKP10_14315 [Gemmatimonadales bacterium]|nr:hypothetical protein [Gemmatimonadales bacterium]